MKIAFLRQLHSVRLPVSTHKGGANFGFDMTVVDKTKISKILIFFTYEKRMV